MAGDRDNRAAEDFLAFKEDMAQEEKRRFVNMREALIDILVELKRDDRRFADKLKKRVLEARSEVELRIIMDGMLVLAGFSLRE